MEMIRWMEDDDVKIMAQVDVSVSHVVGSMGSVALRGQASGAQELMEYPDGAESASGWQYAESEWQ